MRAIAWHGGQEYRLEAAPDPRPGRGQVLVRIEVTAICGSDLHLEDFRATPPVIPGHEASGTIVECGAGVHGLAVGDRVVLDPVQRCGSCYSCTHGIPHLCEAPRHLGWGTCAGTWAELVAVDAANAYRLPPGVTFAAASIVEPAAVCRHSLARAGFQPGMSVLVMGDGPFGFLHAQWARIQGAGVIVVAGHHDARLARIAEAARAVTCNTRAADLSDVVRRTVGAPGVDVAVEATGSSSGPGDCIAQLKPRGTLVIFSYVWDPRALDMGAIHMKELNLAGSCRSQDAFPACIEAISRGELDTESLIGCSVPLERFPEALAMTKRQEDGVFKAALLPSAP